MTKMWLVAALSALLLLGAACAEEPDDDVEADEPDDDTDEVAEDWEPEFDDGVLQPLPSGFPEDSITLQTTKEPEHDDGVYNRVMQSVLNDIAPVSIEVVDNPFPTGAGFHGLNWALSQPGGDEGYILTAGSFMGTSMDIPVLAPEDRYDMGLEDVDPVIATEHIPWAVGITADGPWEDNTWESFVDYAEENPGELRYLRRTGSGVDIAMLRWIDEFDLDVHEVPGGDLEEVATAIGAGEADFSMFTAQVAHTHMQTGRLAVPLVMGDEAEGWGDETVSTADLGYPGEPWSSTRGYFIPSEVPDEHREWLFELISAAVDSDEYQDRVAGIPGATPITQGHEELVEFMASTVELGEPIVRDVGMHWEQEDEDE